MNAGWRRWARIRRRDPAEEAEAELRFHLDARIEDLMARGETPEAARAQALEEFGDLDAVRARLAAIDARIAQRRRRAAWWEGVAQDLRYAVRGLARSPGFTVLVVLTLALGIGANAAVFSMIDRLFFAMPAGVVRPDRVRRLSVSARLPTGPVRGLLPSYTRSVFDYPEVRSLAAALPQGVEAAAYTDEQQPVGASAGSARHTVSYVVGDYFGVLGVRPLLGRFFSPDERTAFGLSPVAVLSDRLWQAQFGASRDVLGQSIDVGPHRYTVVGVAPWAFRGVALDAADLWVPYNTKGTWSSRGSRWYDDTHTMNLGVVLRDMTGRRLPAARDAATRVLRASRPTYDTTATASLLPLNGVADPEFHGREIAIATRLTGVAAIILLIACANVANLMLARAMDRRRETAVRLALGVSRRRLALDVLLESALMAALAGAGAVLAAEWGATLLRQLLFPDVHWGAAAFDPRVGAFAAAVALASGLGAGALPALQGSRSDLTAVLRGGAREGRTARSRSRTILIVVQAALSVVLLAGAGLFVRSLHDVEAVSLGYDRSRLVFAWVSGPQEDTAASRAARARIPAAAERLARLDGVQRVALMMNPPMYGFSFTRTFLPDRDSVPSVGSFGAPVVSFVSPGIFRTLGVRILEGRGFTAGDNAGAEPVLVVNQTLARAYWPGGDAVGRCLILHQRGAPCRRIVGVAADAHVSGIVEGPAAEYYVPLAQAPGKWVAPGTIVIRTAPGRRRIVSAEVALTLREMLGPRVIPSLHAMDEFVAPELQRWALGATLFSAAGLLALLVAAVGIYSAVAYAVSQRAHEMGVRLALGARGANIARLVVWDAVRVVGVGVVLGVAAALALGRLVASLLYGVSPHDPLVLGGVAMSLVVVAIAASLVPAWRAARADPMNTLRAE